MAKDKKPTQPQNEKKKKPETKPATGAQLVNPAQSAATAAAMVAHKVSAPVAAQGPKTESSGFRNLKDSLMKPHSQTIGGVLDKLGPSGQKKSAVPFTGGKQVGHNQTFGADVTRRNVPRRTNG